MVIRYIKSFTPLVGLVLFHLSSLCQQPHFKNYTVNEGLASSQVYDIIQDGKGYIWFATDRGLSRYNGYVFESYSIQDGLPNTSVLRFYQHDNGTIWCTTVGNKLFYIDHDGHFRPYKYNHIIQETVQDITISELVIYRESLYMGFINGTGYIKIDKVGNVANHTIGDKSIAILLEKKGNQQIGYKIPDTHEGTHIFDRGTQFVLPIEKGGSFFEAACIGTTAFISNEQELYLIREGERKLIQSKREPIGIGTYDLAHFWVGFRYGGVVLYDLQGNEIRHLLPDKSVSRVFRDHEGGVWISTLDSGVFYFNNDGVLSHQINSNKYSHIHSLTSNGKGELFIGNYDGEVYKRRGNETTLIYRSKLKRPAKVQYFESLDDVVIHADNKLFKRKTPEIYELKYIKSLSDDDTSPISFGTLGQFGIEGSRYDISKRAHDICVAPQDTLVASVDGIFKYGKVGLTRVHDHELFTNRVDDIDHYRGRYYGASLGAGVIIFERDTFFNIGKKDGLYSDMATEVFVENDSIIWACTNRGVHRITIEGDYSYSIEGISRADGLPSNEVFDLEVIGDTVWVATAKGLCSFQKDIFKQKKTAPLNHYLSLKKINVNDRQTAPNRLKGLSHQENRITLDYQAISFKYEDLVYRYRLEGLEQKWNFTKSLSITYPSLPPGAYTLIVQVKGGRGEWESNGLTLPIVILPAFYTTWWFRGLIALISVVLVYLFFKYRILSYNRDIFRELLRRLLKFLSRDIHYIFIKEAGKKIKLRTLDVLFVRASGNYLEIHTAEDKFVIREKISNFDKIVPDAIEFLRVHRSYIVRIEKVDKEDNGFVYIGDNRIPVGATYREVFKKVMV